MSMPNRCCVNERRLDIIEEKLGIENSVAELNRPVLPGDYVKKREESE